MRRLTLLAPAALLLTGCLASKGDIRLLQDDLTSTRAQQAQQALAQEQARARDDSLARVRLDSAIRALAAINDSLRALSRRVTDGQANSAESMRELGMQLTTLQNRVGMSQRQIQDIAAQREAPPQPAARPDSAAPDSMAPALPGPAQLFKLGRDQYANGAYATARTLFTQILTQYPSYGDVANAAVNVGICFEAENNPAAADSVYQAVVAQYPKSPYAPMALYKYGNSQLQQGKVEAARAAWERVLHDYPTSDEAQLVPDRLKALPGK